MTTDRFANAPDLYPIEDTAYPVCDNCGRELSKGEKYYLIYDEIYCMREDCIDTAKERLLSREDIYEA